MLATIDRLFLVMFARQRRKMGDGRMDAAWHKASWSVSMYLVLPSLLVSFVLVAIVIRIVGAELLAVTTKRNWQICGGILGVAIGILLDRRWERYRSSPPELAAGEASEDKLLIRRLRIGSIGSLALALAVAFYLGSTRT